MHISFRSDSFGDFLGIDKTASGKVVKRNRWLEKKYQDKKFKDPKNKQPGYEGISVSTLLKIVGYSRNKNDPDYKWAFKEYENLKKEYAKRFEKEEEKEEEGGETEEVSKEEGGAKEEEVSEEEVKEQQLEEAKETPPEDLTEEQKELIKVEDPQSSDAYKIQDLEFSLDDMDNYFDDFNNWDKTDGPDVTFNVGDTPNVPDLNFNVPNIPIPLPPLVKAVVIPQINPIVTPSEETKPLTPKENKVVQEVVSQPTIDDKKLMSTKVDEKAIQDALDTFSEDVNKSIEQRIGRIEGDMSLAIANSEGYVIGDMMFRDKLTQEMNTRLDSSEYNLDKVLKGLKPEVRQQILDGIDTDVDRTPAEMILAILPELDQAIIEGKITKSDSNQVCYFLLSEMMYENPKLKAMASVGMGTFLVKGKLMPDSFEVMSFASMLDKKFAVEPEKRAELLGNLKPLDARPFSEEEKEVWANMVNDIGQDAVKDLKGAGEQRLFLKEYVNQLASAQKLLRNSKSPEALQNLVNAIKTDVDGADLRYKQISEGNFAVEKLKVKDPATGQEYEIEQTLNPHIHTKEALESKKEEINKVRRSLGFTSLTEEERSLTQALRDDEGNIDNKKVKALVKEQKTLLANTKEKLKYEKDPAKREALQKTLESAQNKLDIIQDKDFEEKFESYNKRARLGMASRRLMEKENLDFSSKDEEDWEKDPEGTYNKKMSELVEERQKLEASLEITEEEEEHVASIDTEIELAKRQLKDLGQPSEDFSGFGMQSPKDTAKQKEELTNKIKQLTEKKKTAFAKKYDDEIAKLEKLKTEGKDSPVEGKSIDDLIKEKTAEKEEVVKKRKEAEEDKNKIESKIKNLDQLSTFTKQKAQIDLLESKYNELTALEEKMGPVWKQQEELQDTIKKFNQKGSGIPKQRFKINGEPASFEDAVAAKNPEALELKVKTLQGKQYQGKTLLQAIEAKDPEAIADKKILQDYHASKIARREELEGKSNRTKEEEEELSKLKDAGMDSSKQSPQHKASLAVAEFLAKKAYDPLHITKSIRMPKDIKADKGDAMEKLVGSYNTLGNNELKNVHKQIQGQLDNLYKNLNLTKEEIEDPKRVPSPEEERLHQAIDALALVNQTRGLPLPEGRIPVDPQILSLMDMSDSNRYALSKNKYKEALLIAGNLSRGAAVYDNESGKFLEGDDAALHRGLDGLEKVLKLMDFDTFSNFISGLDSSSATTMNSKAKMLEDDFCASGDKKSGTCEPLSISQKEALRASILKTYRGLAEMTPNFFAPAVSGESYMKESQKYLKKKQKGNTFLGESVSDYFGDEARGRGDEEEEETGSKPATWETKLDEDYFQDVKTTRKSLDRNTGNKEPSAARVWKSPQVTEAINEMEDAFADIKKNKNKVTPQTQAKLDKAKEFLQKTLGKELGKAKLDALDKKKLEDIAKQIKQELEQKEPNYTKIDTLFKQKKQILKNSGFDVSKLKSPVPDDKGKSRGSYDEDEDSGDIYGRFSRRASSDNSFILNSLTYSNGRFNTMRKHAYVDYQGRAQLFKPGMSVYHALNGNPSVSGIVRAVYPAIGMVDVQFPMGDQRLPVEDLMIARDIPLDPLLDKASIPGGTGTQPVSAGAVRVASLYMRMKGRR